MNSCRVLSDPSQGLGDPRDEEATWPELPSPGTAGDTLPSLVVISGLDAGVLFRLLSGQTQVGRVGDARDLILRDPGISRRHAHFTLGEEGEARLRDLGSTNGTRVNGEPCGRAGQPLKDGDRIEFGHQVRVRFSWRSPLEEELHRQLYDRATRDTLTGLHNRRYLMDQLEVEMAWASRHGRPLSAVFMDLDHFKTINDRFGHGAGDQVLRGVAGCMRATRRQEDVLARYGGEEFVLLMRDTRREQAAAAAERHRLAVSRAPMATTQGPIAVRLTMGVASTEEPAVRSAEALLRVADERLLRAKAEGRDRVRAS
jgi:two-component system, cell cycle response regulator